MTKAQEYYNEFLTQGHKCRWCTKHFKFSEVINWGDKEGGATNVTCPYCNMSLRMDLPETVKIIKRLGELDKRIVKLLVDYADRGGQFDSHSPYNQIYLKCIMVIKHSPLFNSMLFIRPLPYVERMVMTQIYRELVEAGKIDEINIYEVKAPIPVEVEQPKTRPLTHFGSSKKKKKRSTKKAGPTTSQMTFSIGGGKKKAPSEMTVPVSPELDSALESLLGVSNKKKEPKPKQKIDLSSLDDMIGEL